MRFSYIWNETTKIWERTVTRPVPNYLRLNLLAKSLSDPPLLNRYILLTRTSHDDNQSPWHATYYPISKDLALPAKVSIQQDPVSLYCKDQPKPNHSLVLIRIPSELQPGPLQDDHSYASQPKQFGDKLLSSSIELYTIVYAKRTTTTT